jgi:hypothetical protein
VIPGRAADESRRRFFPVIRRERPHRLNEALSGWAGEGFA